MFRKLAVTAAAVALVGFAACETDSLSAPGLEPTAPTFAVTFDDESGEGFVGKGDVQNAFGWNNKQLQDNANKVFFFIEAEVEYELECTDFAGQSGNVKGIWEATTNVQIDANPDGDPRQTKGQKQFTGFILNGFLNPNGVAPEEGDACPANAEWEDIEINDNGAKVQNGELTSVTVGDIEPTGALYVDYTGNPGDPVQIWP